MVRVPTRLALVAAIALIGGSTWPAIAQGTATNPGAVPANLAPPAAAVSLFELGARGVLIYTCDTESGRRLPRWLATRQA